MPINTRAEWSRLPDVGQLGAGDVLIKHVFQRTEFVHTVIRGANALHVFDTLGSQTAEHAAMVGSVDGRPRIFEAEGEGIRVKGSQLESQHNHYTVFRNRRHLDQFAYLANGMATRLAVIQSENPSEVPHRFFFGAKFTDAVSRAHIRNPQQSTGYGYASAAYSSLTPNLVSDALYSRHDLRVLRFIKGDKKKIRYICSALVAALLQAWNIKVHKRRVFTDPSQVHPCNLEHHLMKGSLQDFSRIGRWGGRDGH